MASVYNETAAGAKQYLDLEGLRTFWGKVDELKADGVSGVAKASSKLGETVDGDGLTVGSVTKPVYFENGVPVATNAATATVGETAGTDGYMTASQATIVANVENAATKDAAGYMTAAQAGLIDAAATVGDMTSPAEGKQDVSYAAGEDGYMSGTQAADLATIKANYVTKDALDTAITDTVSAAYKYRGTVETKEKLDEKTDAKNGDVYNVESNGMNYAWVDNGDGTGYWDTLGLSISFDSIATSDILGIFSKEQPQG